MVSFKLVPLSTASALPLVMMVVLTPVPANSSLMFSVKRLVAAAPDKSVAVTTNSKLPPAALPGVPLKLRVAALKLNQAGKATRLPAASTALAL